MQGKIFQTAFSGYCAKTNTREYRSSLIEPFGRRRILIINLNPFRLIFKGPQSSSIDLHYWHIFDKLPGCMDSVCGQCAFIFSQFICCCCCFLYIWNVFGILERKELFAKGCIPFDPTGEAGQRCVIFVCFTLNANPCQVQPPLLALLSCSWRSFLTALLACPCSALALLHPPARPCPALLALIMCGPRQNQMHTPLTCTESSPRLTAPPLPSLSLVNCSWRHLTELLHCSTLTTAYCLLPTGC